MANNYIKGTACTDKRDVLLKIYQFYAAGGRNWSIVDESAGWAGGAPGNGEFFVLRRAVAWANGTPSQYPELVLAANDSSGSVTFGGAGGTKYTVPARAYLLVWSPDGGWVSATNEFSAPGTLTERSQASATTSSETTNSLYLCDAPEGVYFWSYSTGNSSYYMAMAAEITSLDSAAADPRPSYVGIGKIGASSSTTYIWTSSCGAAPNAGYNGWVVAGLDEIPSVRSDTYGLTRNGGLMAELPLRVYDCSASGGLLGSLIQVRRAGTGIANGTVTTDGSRAFFGGMSVPWV